MSLGSGFSQNAEGTLGSYLSQIRNAFSQKISSLIAAVQSADRAQRAALGVFLVRCTSAALLYLSQIVIARWIGVTDYGIYVSVWTWVLILGGLVHLGFNTTAIRLVPEYIEHRKYALLQGLLTGSRLFAVASGTMVALAGMAGLWLFEDYVSSPYLLPAYLALVCIPLYALTDVQDGIARGVSWMSIALVPPYILRPIIILLTMVAAHGAGLPMEAATAAAAAIAGTWLAGIIQLFALNRKIAKAVSHEPRAYDFPGWLKTSLPLIAASACELAIQNADVLVIAKFLPAADVGIYFAAGKTMALILFVHYAVGSAAAGRFSTLKARGDHEGLAAFARQSVHWTFWPSLAAALAILALGPFLLQLFGSEFSRGYPVMAILVLGFLAKASLGPADYMLAMLGEEKACATVLGMTALAAIGLNILLVPAYGIVGAASATASATAFGSLLLWYAVKRRLGIDIAIWNNLRAR